MRRARVNLNQFLGFVKIPSVRIRSYFKLNLAIRVQGGREPMPITLKGRLLQLGGVSQIEEFLLFPYLKQLIKGCFVSRSSMRSQGSS
jgi:hypothetical protein